MSRIYWVRKWGIFFFKIHNKVASKSKPYPKVMKLMKFKLPYFSWKSSFTTLLNGHGFDWIIPKNYKPKNPNPRNFDSDSTLLLTQREMQYFLYWEREGRQRKEHNEGGRQVGRWWVVGTPKTNTSTVGAFCILQNISVCYSDQNLNKHFQNNLGLDHL